MGLILRVPSQGHHHFSCETTPQRIWGFRTSLSFWELSNGKDCWSAPAGWIAKKKTTSFTSGGLVPKGCSWYCWCRKSGVHQLRLVVFPSIYRVSYIPGGAGFQPSTVSQLFGTMICFWEEPFFLSFSRVQFTCIPLHPNETCSFRSQWE